MMGWEVDRLADDVYYLRREVERLKAEKANEADVTAWLDDLWEAIVELREKVERLEGRLDWIEGELVSRRLIGRIEEHKP